METKDHKEIHPVSESPEANQDQRLFLAQVRQLYNMAPIGIAACLVNSVILTVILWNVVFHPILLAWFSASVLIPAFRYASFAVYRRNVPLTLSTSNRWHMQFIISMALYGLVWGSTAIFLLPEDSLAHQMFIAFLSGGMVAGTAGTLSATMSSFLSYSIPALVPFIVRFFLIGDDVHIAMGGTALLFGVLISFTAKRVNSRNSSTLQLKYENRELIEHLAAEKERIEKLNEELQTEIAERKKAQEALGKAYDDLDLKIQERTQRLVKANEQLRREMEVRKRTEVALRESEEKYRLHFQNVRDVIYSIDTEFKVLSVSPSVKQVLGYSPEELIGRPFQKLNVLAPEYMQTAASDVMRVLSGEEISSSVYEFIAKDGTRKIGEVSGAPLVRDGRIAGVVSVGRDISDRRRLETQLRHAQKMESVGTITSGVAHNFRNILAGVSVNTQLIMIKYADSPALSKIAERIIAEVKRGTQLVEGLMQFSRKQAGKSLDLVNLAELVRDTHEIIRESFDKKITISIDAPQWLPIRGDYGGLSQVLMNFCTNARDAMPDGGELQIEAGADGGHAFIYVSDTGVGMDEETRNNCFDPFFTTKEGRKGTGLGLSTAYGIVKEHGGDIKIESYPGKGTSFEISFPMVMDKEKADQTSPQYKVQGKGKKILIVDDEVEILESMEELFRELGYRISSASGGQEAIEIYNTWKPDIVLLDRNMPEMDGISCAKKIIKNDPSAKIVLVSGYEDEGPHGIDETTKEFIKGYLLKPFEMDQLSKLLSSLLTT